MVAIRTIGPRISQIIQYNDASGQILSVLCGVNADGTVNLRVLAKSAPPYAFVAEYDYALSVGSWSYLDPPVSNARSIGPLFGQIVSYNDAVYGACPAHILAVNGDGSVNLIENNTNGGLTKTEVNYDYTGTIVGAWSYFDPPPTEIRTEGPRIGQWVLYNNAGSPNAAFIYEINADGTVDLYAWPQNAGTVSGFTEVSFDGTGNTLGTWSYADPTVN